jgi:hypothetical protein
MAGRAILRVVDRAERETELTRLVHDLRVVLTQLDSPGGGE